MFDITKFITSLYKKNIVLRVAKDTLKIQCQDNVITPEILETIKKYKEEIIVFLREQDELNKVSIRVDKITKRSFGDNDVLSSYAQQRLWFIDQLQQGSAEYNMPLALQIEGEFDVDVAEQAITRIIHRHETLRTVFKTEDSDASHMDILQCIQTEFNFKIIRYDLTELNEVAQNAKVKVLMHEDSAKTFDLRQDLMVRVSYLHLSTKEKAVQDILLFNMHHIASDGWSMSILLSEFVTQYQSINQGDADPLPPLKIQYADYALWQREWLTGEVLQRQLEYWTKQLEDVPAVHSLPLDYPRPETATYQGAMVSSQLDADLSQRLQKIAQEHQLTPFMLLHAGLALVLSRHSHSQDIVIGTPMANRMQVELEPLIGFFVNTLALRADTRHDTLSDYLAHIRNINLDAQTHQDIPFEQLVEHCNVQRSTQHSPLFQIMFTMDTDTQSDLVIRGVNFHPLESSDIVAKFDLIISAQVADDGIHFSWTYDTSLFTQTHIEILSAHLNRLLAGIAEAPGSKLSDLPMLSEQEEKHLLHTLNDTKVNYSKDKRVHELFEKQAKENPNNVAVVFEDTQLTYQQLNEQANQLAHYLIEQGVKPDTLVGLCIERSVEMIVGLLAVLKAGGAYVPLEPSYPELRLQYMIMDTATQFILTQSHLVERMHLQEQHVVCLDDAKLISVVEEYPQTTPEPNVLGLQLNHLAYVIYTSGSTGQPKGVMVEHAALLNSTMARSEFYQKVTSFLLLSSFAFDSSIAGIFYTLCYGGKLCIVSKEAIHDVRQINEWMKLERVSHLLTIPSFYKLLLESSYEEVLPDLIAVTIAGEACSEDIVLLHYSSKSVKYSKLYNEYGPTEATVWTTVSILELGSTISIGRPIANSQVYILNDTLSLVPVGTCGELCIGGVGLARGYLNQPELTRDKFIANPFSDNPNDRLYMTGDLVRWLADDNLEFIGRIDHQVKIRGYRIELGEIESQLLEIEDVKEAVVLAREDAGQDKRLVAYIVCENSFSGESDEILKSKHNKIESYKISLRAQLLDYMVPEICIFLEALPLSSNGKLDRKALPIPEESDLQKNQYVAPRDKIEQILCALWQQVLGLEKVGIEDNFFAIGGHSLLATRLISLIRQKMKTELPLRALFENPTVADLGKTLNQAENLPVAPPIEVLTERDAIPLSFAQQRLWFIDQLEGSTHYNQPFVLAFNDRFEHQVFEQALQSLIERHEVLRTCFLEREGTAYQAIQAEFKFVLGRESLEELTAEQQQVEVAHLAQEEALRPFDLSRDFMLRARILTLSAESHILLLTTHHIALDGWSFEILTRELSQLYIAHLEGRSSPLTSLSIQYADYAQWQRNWLQGEVLEKMLDYWKQQLADIPPVHRLPLDKVRPEQQTFEGAGHSQMIEPALASQIQALCQSQGVTLFMLLHSAFSVLLGRYSNESDIVVGTPISGRTQQEIEPLIGFFLNNLILRSDLSDNPNFESLLQENKDMILDAYAHQHIPFETLVEALQPERNLSHSPLYQVVFAVQNFKQATLDLPELTPEPYNNEKQRVTLDYELGLHVTEVEDRLLLQWSCNTDVFNQTTIKRLAESFQLLLDGIVLKPDSKIHALPVMSEMEKQKLLCEWNDTQTNYPKDKLIHELFEQQAAKQPDNIAVVFEDHSLTYQSLNEQANQLAHYLVEQGVKPDTLVGLCVERSLDMLIGLLGILKAGGAYVPIDPEYPTERIDYLLQDSGVELVLTQRELMLELTFDGLTVLPLDNEMRTILWGNHSKDNLDSQQLGHHSAQLAYVIYTSGTTGQAKGVMATHRNVTRLVHGSQNYVDQQQPIKALLASQISFDAATFEIWVPLLTGGNIICYPENKIDVDSLNKTISSNNVNLVWLTAGLFDVWVENYKVKETTLKTVVTGGDIVSSKSVKKLYEKYPMIQVVNGYGPTECVTFSSVHVIEQNFQSELALPIGKPVSDTTVYVLSNSNELVPTGAIGELYIGGDGVARGYLNQDALTNEKFITNPFSDDKNERLYRTGDLVRWLPDGNLDFIGRVDYQVKVRGFRIELGEIEHALTQCESVKEAVVLVHSGGETKASGNKRLVAYVVPSEADVEQDNTDVIIDYRRHLQSHLPDYMMPSMFVLLDKLPLTINGKVDRKALPEPGDSDVQRVDYEAPSNEIEKTLCEVWKKVLGLEQVGIQDNFFSLGGDSILSIRVVSQAKSCGLMLSVKNIFKYQTLAQLAAQLTAGNLSNTESIEVTPFSLLTDNERASLGDDYLMRYDDIYPMSELQQGMVFHTQLDPLGEVYHDVLSMHLQCTWQESSFRQALRFMFQQYPVLRTGYDLEGERPLQYVQKVVDLPLLCSDIRHLSQLEQEAFVSAWIKQERTTPFDWEGPLYKVFIHQRSATSFELGLSFHHAVYDGWSNSVFISQLLLQYQNLLSKNSLPPASVDYVFRDFIVLEQAALASSEAKDFWMSMLDGAPTQQIPCRPIMLDKQHNPGNATYEVSNFSKLTVPVLALTKNLGVPLQSVLLAVHSKVLTTLSGQLQALSSVVFNGRPESEGGEKGLGLFLNSLPISIEMIEGSWATLIQSVASQLTDCLAFRHYPSSAIQRDTGCTFAEVLFNYTHFHAYQDVIEQSDIECLDMQGFAESNYNFSIDFERAVDVEHLSLFINYDTELYEASNIERIGEYYVNAFNLMLADVSQSHHECSLLSQAERQQLLVDWNDTEADYPQDQLIHELFETQVAQTPNNIAVVFDDKQLSYQALNEASNRLAHYLRAQGVEAETLVGICVERSLEMIVGILAILKAGGAYVPLDPNYPQARLDYMVQDADLKHLLTQSRLTDKLNLGDDVHLVELDEISFVESLSKYPSTNLSRLSDTEESHLAYVIYTSGSTGKPKGVMVEHGHWCAYQASARSIYQLVETDKVLQFSSVSFDIFIEEFSASLLSGGCLFLLHSEKMLKAADFWLAINLNRVTVASLPTAYWHYLCVEPNLAEHLENTSLRLLIAGGEVLSKNSLSEWQKVANKAVRLLNTYGPTEATVIATYYDVTQYEPTDVSVPIGSALTNSNLLIMSVDQKLVPQECVGELYIGGTSVARGYLNQPELTAERFIQNPYSDDPNARLYKTGDFVRYLPDGQLEFLGRLDDQVKIRGFRIELGEIESHLSNCDSVASCLVLAREDEPGQKRLVAYVVAKESENVDDALDDSKFVSELRELLQKTLPGYMVPSAFVVLAEFPLTTNGKVDREALPVPDESLMQGEYVAPATETEHTLVGIWAKLLKLEPESISVTANFFELGGHSLLLIRLLTAIENETSFKFDLRQIYANASIKEMSELTDYYKLAQRLESSKGNEKNNDIERVEF